MLFEMEFLYFFILSIFIQFTDANLSKRFEYKHSFKGPHLVQKDRTVPFWTYVGSKLNLKQFEFEFHFGIELILYLIFKLVLTNKY